VIGSPDFSLVCGPQSCALRQPALILSFAVVRAALAEKPAMDLAVEADKPIDEILSDREFEVFRSIASGKTVSQIAEQLRLRVKTVSTYRSRILEKMGMKTNAELTHYAVRNNLVD